MGRRSGLLELAIVLAMQTLGGDPQSAYLLGWAAGGYAAAMLLMVALVVLAAAIVAVRLLRRQVPA